MRIPSGCGLRSRKREAVEIDLPEWHRVERAWGWWGKLWGRSSTAFAMTGSTDARQVL